MKKQTKWKSDKYSTDNVWEFYIWHRCAHPKNKLKIFLLRLTTEYFRMFIRGHVTISIFAYYSFWFWFQLLYYLPFFNENVTKNGWKNYYKHINQHLGGETYETRITLYEKNVWRLESSHYMCCLLFRNAASVGLFIKGYTSPFFYQAIF